MNPKTEQDASRFWSDGFDMDLLAILPNLKERIGPVGDRVLWTFGSLTRDGGLSHPAVWHTREGLAAFFWTAHPSTYPDEHGWVSINGYTTNDPLCQVTVLNAIRDCWCHGYLLLLNGARVLNMSTKFYGSHFEPIMAGIRGYGPTDGKSLLPQVEGWAVQGAYNIKVLLGM